MALVVEDGTIVEGAQSYATVADLVAYASARGAEIPESEPEREQLLIKAMDYLEGLRARYQGEKTSADQPLQWPRSGVTIDGFMIGSHDLPRELVYAQLALAIEANGADIMPNAEAAVTREKVGPIEVEYDNRGKVLGVSAFAKSAALIAPLLRRNGLMAVRS